MKALTLLYRRGVRRLGVVLVGLAVPAVRAEVLLQYFNTSWRELTEKIPELAEVGYTALWLPPPTKGSGALSVGYDLWDPLDLGGKDQRGTVRTRYGTEAELLRLIETAHRFGLRVYVDNIMNHRAFDVPGYNEYTPINIYPGMVPEDFHLRVTEEGFYRKWDNVANWGDTWQIQFRNFSHLIDIAQESPDNGNFGPTEGGHIPKIRFVRHPDHPEFYCYAPSTSGVVYVGFGSTHITSQVLTNPANAWLYEEDVNAYLIRAVRWLVDRAKVDGLRLDAVKHVPDYFFGQMWGEGKDASGAGYCGQAQEQFNLTRGFSDWDNHRDSLFNAEQPRDDLMMFGEHLGEPPSYGGYIDAGMRLVDNRLHGFLNGNLGQPWGNLDGLQYAGGQGFSAGTGVPYTKSHDDDYATRPELHFALNLTREGLPNVYTDGNYQSPTLGESGGAFPRHANTAFLGQFGDHRLPNLVYIHNHFARGWQVPRWGDQDVVAYDRVDKREKGDMSDADGAVLFFVMNDNYAAGQYREISTSFPVGAHLWQYSSAGGNFYYVVPPDQKIKVITPPGGYFAFSWRSPEESDLWAGGGGRPLTIYQDGQPAGWMAYVRRDGPDGDPAFNPYGAADSNREDFAYTWYVPRVTAATNLRFVARVDGSAKNVLMRLDGGMDLNGLSHPLGDPRDNPPALSTDVFLGYESCGFVQRQYREKFAARNTESNNVIGSAGAETYLAAIGTAGFTVNPGAPGRDSDAQTAAWSYHDPAQNNDRGQAQFFPPPESAGGTNLTLWAKIGYAGQINRLVAYYTTDGQTYPEGAGGEGIGVTRAAEMVFDHADAVEGTVDWWKATLPPLTNGTALRYKIGAFWQQGDGSWYVPFPNTDYDIGIKRSMMGVWEITDFNAAAAAYRPHNDYGAAATGLAEGFHLLAARAFLERDDRASIYNTFVQPFYLDTETPRGEIKYPGPGDELFQNEYGVVVRTDPTVVSVWYHLEDSDPANDDAQTGDRNGNGTATNALGEPVPAWVPAARVTPNPGIASPYPDEWRFSYRNIPSGASNALLQVRLLELSSSSNMTLTDVEGHWTTLIRTNRTSAPAYQLFFQWPTEDGAILEAGWTFRVYFSKELGEGLDDETLRARFLIRINDNAQGQELYRITRDVDGTHGQIEYDMPNVFDGDPDRLHHIEVTHTTGGGVRLEAHRYVRMRESDRGPHVDIINPPEYDSDGKPYEIVLPDTASPRPEDRQFTIRVETDLSARNVWIAFTNSAGSAGPLAASSNALPGTVSVTAGTNAVTGHEQALSGTVTVAVSNTLVTGTATAFSNELATSNTIRIGTNLLVVTQIVSQTELRVAPPYPGESASGLAAYVRPAFHMELSAGDRIVVAGYLLRVARVESPSNLLLTAAYPGGTASGLTAYRVTGNPSTSGARQYWEFLWTNLTAGTFRLLAQVDTNEDLGTVEATAVRNTRVILREMVADNPADLDDDDDGLYDADETVPKRLPDTNPETWASGDVHVWQIFGRTDPLRPDTDGDGLPDGLESGWRVPIDTDQTDPATDTNGDGFPNFIGDLDPPFYNTVPDNSGLPNYVFNDSRTKLIHGSLTDPNRPDTDYDGIKDGIEDWNRNGWVDGDGKALMPDTGNPWDDRPTPADWPDGVWDAAWRETDPNNPDSDRDGASDGYGEDKDFDGWIAGDVNSNRMWESGELWTETDPLNPDTDGDGLPDGWEIQYEFDPLDDGVTGHTNMRTGAVITNALHGAAGNPDGDWVVVGGATNDYTNLMEYQNGTNPRIPDSGEPPPQGRVVVGPGPEIGPLNGVTQYQEFADWTAEDCLALDEYEGDGPNNQQGDLFLGWDGWDSSRDLVAFYAHDGGDIGSGGDGRFYFRVDLHDLQPYAEEKNLDIYVVIDTGNPSVGEMNLPDQVDCVTSCRWEAVVAVYQSSRGRVYVDLDRGNNTTSVGQDLFSFGVVARDQSSPNGFIDAYFNSELDAVEFCISRQALLDAGWSGIGATNFNYQVFTTKDGTGNDPVGPGDIGGRNDVRDTITDDWVAEDYWQAQQGIQNVLRYWIPGTSRAGRAKVAFLIHGNQAIQPGSTIQALLNTGEGAGYYRALDPHATFRQPLGLHVSATLAAAIEWAKADPAAGKPWRDGPAFNDRIAALARTNVVELLHGTFSDHILPYFTKEYNRENERLARAYLERIYGGAPAVVRTVFWTPERVLDADVFDKIRDMGYAWTVMDQDTHMFYWFGRGESLNESGYRINEIHGVKCFVINNGASEYRFSNTDRGLPLALRSLLNRKARSGIQDQVVLLFSNWEDFTDKARADAYDLNVRWLANHPWTPVVGLGQIARGEVDVWGGPGGDDWYVISRGSPALSKQGHNWINHATQGNYDEWYVGSPLEEGLESKFFEIRPGMNVPQRYGMLYNAGIVSDTWSRVRDIADSNLAALAGSALHASVFETAFHDEDNNDLRRYSTGEYVWPASGYHGLASFARHAQAQTRTAAVYRRVDQWAAVAAHITTPQTAAEDVDLDGEPEYLLYNDRLFAVFERIGGRMTAAWVRDILGGGVYQTVGNLAGYAGSETEEEGTYNVDAGGAIGAYRTSGLKDWWDGSRSYVNDLYTFAPRSNGWQITSSDSHIRKTVTLAAKSPKFEVAYDVSVVLYVRTGLSPNLYDLLVCGQQNLGGEVHGGGVMRLANSNAEETVTALVGYGDAGHAAGFNVGARDEDPAIIDFATLNMRNQAQTHQIELVGTNAFGFSLGFTAGPSDLDGNGMPDAWERQYGLHTNELGGAEDDADGDSVDNRSEYIAGTHPLDELDYPRVTQVFPVTTGVVVRFAAKPQREYGMLYRNRVPGAPAWSNAMAEPITVPSEGIHSWTDDGSATVPHPFALTNRFYKVRVKLPQ